MPEQKISFNKADRDIPTRERTALKQFIAGIFKKEKTSLEKLSYVFCSDSYLLKINQAYLGHEDYTDIITFDLSEGKSKIGEIYISTDRVKDNARKLDIAFSTEVLRVMFHGVLHLCGFKDKSSSETRLMRQKEEEYLIKWFRFIATK